MTAREHLEWAIDRALEYYDMGDKDGAMTSFISDVGKHDGTAHIQTNSATMMILMMNLNRGRSEFEKAMRGFAVIDSPAPEA